MLPPTPNFNTPFTVKRRKTLERTLDRNAPRFDGRAAYYELHARPNIEVADDFSADERKEAEHLLADQPQLSSGLTRHFGNVGLQGGSVAAAGPAQTAEGAQASERQSQVGGTRSSVPHSQTAERHDGGRNYQLAEEYGSRQERMPQRHRDHQPEEQRGCSRHANRSQMPPPELVTYNNHNDSITNIHYGAYRSNSGADGAERSYRHDPCRDYRYESRYDDQYNARRTPRYGSRYEDHDNPYYEPRYGSRYAKYDDFFHHNDRYGDHYDER